MEVCTVFPSMQKAAKRTILESLIAAGKMHSVGARIYQVKRRAAMVISRLKAYSRNWQVFRRELGSVWDDYFPLIFAQIGGLGKFQSRGRTVLVEDIDITDVELRKLRRNSRLFEQAIPGRNLREEFMEFFLEQRVGEYNEKLTRYRARMKDEKALAQGVLGTRVFMSSSSLVTERIRAERIQKSQERRKSIIVSDHLGRITETFRRDEKQKKTQMSGQMAKKTHLEANGSPGHKMSIRLSNNKGKMLAYNDNGGLKVTKEEERNSMKSKFIQENPKKDQKTIQKAQKKEVLDFNEAQKEKRRGQNDEETKTKEKLEDFFKENQEKGFESIQEPKKIKRKDSDSSASVSVSSEDSQKKINPFPPRLFKTPTFIDICKFVQMKVDLKKLIEKHVLPFVKN